MSDTVKEDHHIWAFLVLACCILIILDKLCSSRILFKILLFISKTFETAHQDVVKRSETIRRRQNSERHHAALEEMSDETKTLSYTLMSAMGDLVQLHDQQQELLQQESKVTEALGRVSLERKYINGLIRDLKEQQLHIHNETQWEISQTFAAISENTQRRSELLSIKSSLLAKVSPTDPTSETKQQTTYIPLKLLPNRMGATKTSDKPPERIFRDPFFESLVDSLRQPPVTQQMQPALSEVETAETPQLNQTASQSSSSPAILQAVEPSRVPLPVLEDLLASLRQPTQSTEMHHPPADNSEWSSLSAIVPAVEQSTLPFPQAAQAPAIQMAVATNHSPGSNSGRSHRSPQAFLVPSQPAQTHSPAETSPSVAFSIQSPSISPVFVNPPQASFFQNQGPPTVPTVAPPKLRVVFRTSPQQPTQHTAPSSASLLPRVNTPDIIASLLRDTSNEDATDIPAPAIVAPQNQNFPFSHTSSAAFTSTRAPWDDSVSPNEGLISSWCFAQNQTFEEAKLEYLLSNQSTADLSPSQVPTVPNSPETSPENQPGTQPQTDTRPSPMSRILMQRAAVPKKPLQKIRIPASFLKASDDSKQRVVKYLTHLTPVPADQEPQSQLGSLVAVSVEGKTAYRYRTTNGKSIAAYLWLSNGAKRFLIPDKNPSVKIVFGKAAPTEVSIAPLLPSNAADRVVAVIRRDQSMWVIEFPEASIVKINGESFDPRALPQRQRQPGCASVSLKDKDSIEIFGVELKFNLTVRA